jgi:hypothetical protein
MWPEYLADVALVTDDSGWTFTRVEIATSLPLYFPLNRIKPYSVTPLSLTKTIVKDIRNE